MSQQSRVRRALLSVHDKTGLVEFASALHAEFGIELISTGGTARVLQDAGLPVTPVEKVTGFPEMLDGRVKTLHPRIHAAILADRDNPEHMRQLAEQGIEPIDMVVVNLYPFERTIAKPGCTFEEAIEMIDIGGPCLLRAAAKNHKHVLVLHDPVDWQHVLTWLRGDGLSDEGWQEVRRNFAASAFRLVCAYNAAITDYLVRQGDQPGGFRALLLSTWDRLRYGENPHQSAEVLRPGPGLDLPPGPHVLGLDRTRSPSEVELSFNNYADASAALELCAELTRAGKSNVWHRLTAGGKVWHRLIAGDIGAQGNPEKKARWRAIDDEVFTRRNLPHIQRPGATYFVTFRTREGTLAPEERDLVMECCLFADRKTICLHEAAVMPDHVHLIFTPLDIAEGEICPLSKIMHGIKGNAGRKVADHRGRGSGPVWLDESFDHLIRDEAAFWEALEYVYANPSRAGLEGPYPWTVFEDEPAWDPVRRGAAPNTEHVLHSEGQPRSSHRHRLLAGATLEATPAGVCFIKHTNACGVAVGDDPIEVYRRAYLGDPSAAMGGILAVNFSVDAEFAAAVMETYQRWGRPLKEAGAAQAPAAFFVEVWLAPSFEDDAVNVIRTKKDWGKRVRLLSVGDMGAEPDRGGLDLKRIAGGVLVQTRDLVGLDEDQWKVVTRRQPTEAEMDDLRLAWLICKHTKSNAITICKDGMLIGNGAGQMSRVMSCRIATWLAQENGHADRLKGAAGASDAFFPFRDGPDLLADAGVTALIQPGGSKRDPEVIAACDERGVAMIFTGTRHFRH